MAADSDGTFVLRQLVEELGAQLRTGAEKLGDLPQETGERIARELGLVTRDEWDALELRETQRQRVELLPRHEPELACEALARLLRQVAELLDAGAQLNAELFDELPEGEAAIWRGHEGGASCAAAAGARASRWRRPNLARRRLP